MDGYFDAASFDSDYFDTGSTPTPATGRHAVRPVYLGRIEDDAEELVWLLPFDEF